MSQSLTPGCILFDWDGTLVDTFDLIFAAQNHVFETFGMPLWSEEEARLNIRKSAREAYPALFGKRTEEALACFYIFVKEKHIEALKPLDYAENLITRLNDRGIKLGVVSNKQDRLLQKEVEALGWSPHFQSIIGAGRAMADKPAPDSLQMALEQLQITATQENVWYVGDTETDMVAAKAAGVKAVLVNPMTESRDCDLFFSELEDLKNHFM